jgi:hypothetical protein
MRAKFLKIVSLQPHPLKKISHQIIYKPYFSPPPNVVISASKQVVSYSAPIFSVQGLLALDIFFVVMYYVGLIFCLET